MPGKRSAKRKQSDNTSVEDTLPSVKRPRISKSKDKPQQMPSADEIATALLKQMKESGQTMPQISDGNIDSQDAPSTKRSKRVKSKSSDHSTNLMNTDQSEEIQNDVYTFQPPLTTDPEIVQQNTGTLSTSGVSPMSTSSPLLKHSIPLGIHVTEKTRSLIMSDNYVDFVALLPNCFDDENNDDVLFQNGNVTITKNRTKKVLTSIWQWTNSFDIFMSIYLTQHQESVQALIKYGFNIRAMSKQFGFQAAKSYDEQFRKLKKFMNFDWGTINDELWRSAAYGGPFSNQPILKKNLQNQGKFVQNPFPGKAQPQKFPPGYCWAYCKSGICNDKLNCKLKHICVHCSQPHATTSCTDPQKRSNTSATATKKQDANTHKTK